MVDMGTKSAAKEKAVSIKSQMVRRRLSNPSCIPSDKGTPVRPTYSDATANSMKVELASTLKPIISIGLLDTPKTRPRLWKKRWVVPSARMKLEAVLVV